MMKKKRLPFGVLFYVFFSVSCFGQSATVQSFEKKGLRCLFIPQPEAHLTSILFRLRGGSSLEQKEEQGFAHLLEHLVYRGGSKKFAPGLFRQKYRSQLFGGFTNRKFVDFSLLVEGRSTLNALEDLWDAVFHLQIRAAAFQKEIPIILNENQGKDFFTSSLESFDVPNSFAHSPMGEPEKWPTTITENSSEFLALEQFYQRIFQPNQLELIIVGKFKVSEISQFLERETKNLKRISSVQPETFSFQKQDLSFGGGRRVLWGIRHQDPLELRLLKFGLENGFAGYPSLSEWLEEISLEATLFDFEKSSILFLTFFGNKTENSEKFEKKLNAYFRGITSISKKRVTCFLENVSLYLETQKESVLKHSSLLHEWACLFRLESLEQLQQKILRCPLTFLKNISFRPWLRRRAFSLSSIPMLDTVAPPTSREPEKNQKKWFPKLSHPKCFQEKLSNQLDFCYQGIPSAQAEGFTLLLGGQGDRRLFESWAKLLKQQVKSPFLRTIKGNQDYLVINLQAPVGYLEDCLLVLQQIFSNELKLSKWSKPFILHSPAEKLGNALWTPLPALRINHWVLAYSGPTKEAELSAKLSQWKAPDSWQDWLPFKVRQLEKKKYSFPVFDSSFKEWKNGKGFWLFFGWKAVPPFHPDFIPLKIICEWFGTECFETFVYQELLAYKINFYCQDLRINPIIFFKIKISSSQEQQFKDLFFQLQKKELTAAKLEQAKKDLRNQFILSLRTQADYSYSMARFKFLGLPFDLHQQVDFFFKNISLLRLKQVYQKYFVDQNPLISFESF